MNCDAVCRIVTARPDREWPPDVSAHCVGCDTCLTIAIERVLERPPSVTPPPGFADRVASHVVPGDPQGARWRGVGVALAGIVASVVAVGSWAAGWDGFAISSEMPWFGAIMLLAAGEAVVLIGWTAHLDGCRMRTRGRQGAS